MGSGGILSYLFKTTNVVFGEGLLPKAHNCTQQLVGGLISIKQAPGMNSKMTRVTKLKKRSGDPVPQDNAQGTHANYGSSPGM